MIKEAAEESVGIDQEALVNLPPALPILLDENAVEDILGVRLLLIFCTYHLEKMLNFMSKIPNSQKI